MVNIAAVRTFSYIHLQLSFTENTAVQTNGAFFYGLKYYDIKELRNSKLIGLQTRADYFLLWPGGMPNFLR